MINLGGMCDYKIPSLIPRPFPAPVFDHLEYAPSLVPRPLGSGLGTRLSMHPNLTSSCCMQKEIINWSQGRSGNEARSTLCFIFQVDDKVEE